jgi:hypothetical protein
VNEIESKGKLELLLTANSYTQHALVLKDHLVWLYAEEMNFLIDILKGEMSLRIQLALIAFITVSFGILNLFGLTLKLVVLHLLLKHSKFGQFYRLLVGHLSHFADLTDFYQNLHKLTLPAPFKFEDDDELTVEIVEIIDQNAVIQFRTGKIDLNINEIASLKPILDLMDRNSVTSWQLDNSMSSWRVWKWSVQIKYDYGDSEMKLIEYIYKSTRADLSKLGPTKQI